MTKEKEDPDDVIMTDTGYRIVSTLGAYLELKDNYKERLEQYIFSLNNYLNNLTTINKNSYKHIKFLIAKINIYSKLVFIAENYEEYEKCIEKAYDIMCSNSKYQSENDLNKIKKQDKILSKILSKQNKKELK